MSTKTTAAFGTWQSPITAESLVTGAANISEVIPDGDSVWWAESRPSEGGRIAIMRWQAGDTIEITPPDSNVRTTVHEYGGGAWWAQQNTLWYVDYRDQRIRVLRPNQAPEFISAPPPSPKAHRFADLRLTPDARWLIAVSERHDASWSEPRNLLTAIATDGSFTHFDLAAEADFYGSPSLSPDGQQIAWVQWLHPNMPWEDTSLMLADLSSNKDSISLSNIQCVAGGDDESIVQPSWSPDGRLHYLSDRDDFWHLYVLNHTTPVLTLDGDIGYPPWVHGISRYAFDEQGKVAAACFKGGIDTLDGHPDQTAFHSIRTDGSKLAFASASWSSESSVYFDDQVVRTPRETGLSPAYMPAPEIITFPTGADVCSGSVEKDHDAEHAHALFYAPANPEFCAPVSEKPPLIVLAHGGPTSAARPQLSLAQRFWTSRGFAVVDVNYRGSSGFGRRYRKKLNAQWGIADVQDCVAVARFLVERGDVDASRLIIRGGSAGGFTVLSALAFHDTFTAGASLYGVADLEALANDTHKFESRYLDSLIGDWPEDAAIYAARSPINHLDGFKAPMIVLQGSEDTIVPPNQSRMIVDALDKCGVAVAYLEFEGEQHGFRHASTIVKATQSELTFYGRVFGFTPDGETTSLNIRNQ